MQSPILKLGVLLLSCWSFIACHGSMESPSSDTEDLRRPSAIVGGYYPNWPEAPVRIRDVPMEYNLIYLFSARPIDGQSQTVGTVTWTMPGNGKGAATHFKEDIQYARKVQGRKIILSIGGAGYGMSFPTRQKSQSFLDSVIGLYNEFGGFDGLDWNTFEADQAPDTEEMIWMSLELKRRFPGFLITAPPAPWSARDKEFCRRMVEAGAMDYAAPQYYDGPNLATKAYMKASVDEWSRLVGEEHLLVGFGIWNMPNYMSIEEAVATWKEIETHRPHVVGAFNWALHLDEMQGWPFATKLAPLVRQ